MTETLEQVIEPGFSKEEFWREFGISGSPRDYLNELPESDRSVIVEDREASCPILSYIGHLIKEDVAAGRTEIKYDVTSALSLSFFDRYDAKPEFRKHYYDEQRKWLGVSERNLRNKKGKFVSQEVFETDLLKDVASRFDSQRFRAFFFFRHPNEMQRSSDIDYSNGVDASLALKNPTHCPSRAYVLHLLKNDGMDSLEFFAHYLPRSTIEYRKFREENVNLYSMIEDQKARNLAVHATYVFRNPDKVELVV